MKRNMLNVEQKICDLINSIHHNHCQYVVLTDLMFGRWYARLTNGEQAYDYQFVNWFGSGGDCERSYNEIWETNELINS